MGSQIGMKGLRLVPNHFTVERGAALVADNCVIPSKLVMEPRRGEPRISYSFGSSTHRARATHMFQSKQLIWRDTANAFTYDTGAAFTDLSGSYLPPDAATLSMKFADMAKSCYFTTSLGPYALAAFNATPRAGGLPRPKDFHFVANNVASGGVRLTGSPDAGWMTKNTSVGYRALIGLLDANSVIRLSAPSGRLVVPNPADVNVQIGSLVRAGGIVTATVTSHGFRSGDSVNMTSAGEANFANGFKSITSVTSTTFVYAEAGANAASTVLQTFSSGSKNTQVEVLIPAGLAAGSHFVQLYRTRMSASAGADPRDEMFQVYERFVTTADIAAGSVTIADTCPESAFQGAPLYVNAISGQGALQANTQPPIANDICVWDNRLWLAQTTDRQRLTFRIIGIGSPSGLQTGDVVCLGPNAFKAGTDFTLVSEYTPSQNLSLTLAQLIYQHNTFALQTPTSLCYALEDGSIYPASILFEEVSIGGATTYAACSRASAVAERLPGVTAVTVASTSRTANVVTVRATGHGFTTGRSVMLATSFPDANFPTGLKTVTVIDANNFTYAETGTNAVMSGTYYVYLASYPSSANKLPLRYSKQLEPEACPLTNYPLGLPDNATVLRIMPLRDKLYVFLQYGDIYTVSGSWPYQVQRVDGTAQILAPDTLVEHAGRLHVLTTQGVVAISDGGVEVLSFDIEPQLESILGNALAAVRRYAFAVSYESDRQYQLWVPSTAGLTYCDRAYVYGSLVRDWTRWTQNVTCGLVDPVVGKLKLGCGDDNTIRVENKAFARADFSDETVAVATNAGSAGLNVVCDADPLIARIKAGDFIDASVVVDPLITQRWLRIASVNAGAFTLTLDDTASAREFVVQAQGGVFANVYRAVTSTVSLVPDFASAPDAEKQWRELKAHFAFMDVSAPTFNFSNEKATTQYPVSVAFAGYSGVLEEAALPPVVLRSDIPEEVERGVLLYPSLTIAEPFAVWRLCGMTSTGDPTTERTGQ